jgi:hypothetical protein
MGYMSFVQFASQHDSLHGSFLSKYVSHGYYFTSAWTITDRRFRHKLTVQGYHEIVD